jgi:uncharacterized repeat protein (TIGR02543 family)
LSLWACGHQGASSGNPDGSKSYEVEVSLTRIDGASGAVTSSSDPSGPELDCGATCTVTRQAGVQMTLTAQPASGYYFGGWGGDCTGFAPTCTISVTQARTVTVAFTPANRVFVTSEKHSVSEIKNASTLGGSATEAQKMLSGADAICRRLGGSKDVYAWIASAEEGAATRLPPSARGFVRQDGLPFKDQLVGGAGAIYPILFDEGGHGPSGSLDDDAHFTGANPDGKANDFFNCRNWTSVSSSDRAQLGFRSSSAYGTWWSSAAATGACDDSTKAALLCLGTKYAAYVPLPRSPPAGGRLMFGSKPVATGAGVAGFDAECQAEAAAAHLPGTYRAFVATSASSAAGRFQSHGVPLFRPDGAQIAETDSKLLSGTASPATTVDVTANLAFVDDRYFWTSAQSPTALSTMDCGDYTNSNQVVDASIGDLYGIDRWFNDQAYASCDDKHPVYCLED